MFKQYQIRHFKRSKSKSPNVLIRSPAFMKKSEDGIPKINKKAIPLHHTYLTSLFQNTNATYMPQNDWQFWGCVNTEHYLPSKKRCESSETKRRIFSPSENLLRKYIKRRPSLTCVRRSYDFENEQQVKTDETIIKNLNRECITKMVKQKQIVHTPNSNRSKKTNTTLGTHGEQQIFEYGNNLGLVINKTQGEPTNHHTRRYVNILQRRKRRSQCRYYSNKNQYQ